MTLFDRYIAVDWSAHNQEKSGKDSIWIGDWHRGRVSSTNPLTRHAAMTNLTQRILQSAADGERVLLGFDFAFGYPEGAAALFTGTASWSALWSLLHDEIEDDETNASNRFLAAGRINSGLPADAPRYWGHPWQHAGRYAGLTPKKPANNHLRVGEKRQVELLNSRTQAVWKLSGAGAVGSQSLLGIPRLQKLRTDHQIAARAAVWPFETSFDGELQKPIAIVELFPSIVDVSVRPGDVRDRLQVEAIAGLFASADRHQLLGKLLSKPSVDVTSWTPITTEEGWIVGVGHEQLVEHIRGLS